MSFYDLSHLPWVQKGWTLTNVARGMAKDRSEPCMINGYTRHFYPTSSREDPGDEVDFYRGKWSFYLRELAC